MKPRLAYQEPNRLRPPGVVPVALKPQPNEVYPTYLCDWDTILEPLEKLLEMLRDYPVRHPGSDELGIAVDPALAFVVCGTEPAYIEVTYRWAPMPTPRKRRLAPAEPKEPTA